jgi:hypothetical protein
MSKKKNVYLLEIDRYISFLSNLSEDDIFKLQKGDSYIKFELMSNENNLDSNLTKNADVDVVSIIDELYRINTREDGILFLQSKCFSKTDFEAVAKKLDVPFQKKDSIEKIKNKIIEGTIGFRLRSQAIQGI